MVILYGTICVKIYSNITQEVIMAVLSIAICDDDLLDLEDEKRLIEDVLSEQNKHWEIDAFTSPSELLQASKNYHVVFLDVEMDDLNGIETAEAIHTKSPECLIFFVTNHEDYMDEALNKHAFRFWTKPINRARLIYGIQSANRELDSRRKSIIVNVNKISTKIYMSDILYIYHSGRFTYIVTKKGEIKTSDTFRNVSEQLTDECFAESHASCYVNLNYVSDYNKTDIICEYDGKKYNAYISTRKYSAFNKRFREWSSELQ